MISVVLPSAMEELLLPPSNKIDIALDATFDLYSYLICWINTSRLMQQVVVVIRMLKFED